MSGEVDIFFRLPWPTVTGNHQYDHGGGGTRLKPEVWTYRQQVRGVAVGRRVADLKLPAPLWVEYHLTPPSLRRYDTENVLKVVKDAITLAGIWVDDSNLVLLVETMHWRPADKRLASVGVFLRSYVQEDGA